MKILKNLGLASIISVSLIGCATVKSGVEGNYTNNTSIIQDIRLAYSEATKIDNIKSFIKKELHRGRDKREIRFNYSDTDKSKMMFMPDKMYTLDECLVGNYRLTIFPGDSLHTKVVVEYFNHKDEKYQQAFFARNVYGIMEINAVEIDWSRDGLTDMRLISQVAIERNDGKVEKKLKLINYDQFPMTDYNKPLPGEVYSASNSEK